MSNREEMVERVAHRYSDHHETFSRSKESNGYRYYLEDESEVRQIPEGYDFDKDRLQDLSRVLWGLSCSLGHLVSSHTKFTKIKAVEISPDGKLGGEGYVQEIKEMRQNLSSCIETISETIDTIHDEVEASHWNEEWSNMSQEEIEETEEMIEDSEDIVEDPEDFVEEEFEEDIENEL